MTILPIAWKNIWRNKVRSGIITGAIVIGLFAGTFVVAFMSGWVNTQIRSDVDQQIGDIQIHRPAYTDNHDISEYFLRAGVDASLDTVAAVRDIAWRVRIDGMVASAAGAAGVRVNMVDPDAERRAATLWQAIPDSLGGWFADTAARSIPVVISEKTAEKLKVRLRSKVVVTFQDVQGEMVSFALRVTGIFHTSNTAFDESNIYVRHADLAAATGLPDGAYHEAAVRLTAFDRDGAMTPRIASLLPGLQVDDWRTLSPALSLTLGWMDMIGIIILAIFMLALAFGIVNTMLMAVLERQRELGMLMCIGMNRRRVFRMIMTETLLLTFLGSAAGVFLGWLTIRLTAESGINLAPLIGSDFEDFGFGNRVYPEFDAAMFSTIAILVFATGLLSAIYPAVKALKLNPVESIRTE